MSISEMPKRSAIATSVRFTEHEIVVALADGRSVSAPLEWFPRLRDASEASRNNWRLIGGGVGLHWEEIDEDVSVEGLLAA